MSPAYRAPRKNWTIENPTAAASPLNLQIAPPPDPRAQLDGPLAR
jgi:hypothetical protein